MRQFAIGDIHGCLKTFRYLVEEVIQLNPDDHLYLLGDYIDRGPDGKGVLDYIMNLLENGYKVIPVLGNHEEMLLKAQLGYDQLMTWLFNGGKTTLKSFGIEDPPVSTYRVILNIPEKYKIFLRNMKIYVKTEQFIFVHAGIDFSVDKPFLDKHSMLWTRSPVIDKEKLDGKRIIHGHNAISLSQIKKMVEDPETVSICVDGGCCYKDRIGLGNLVGINLETNELVWKENIE